MNRGGHMTMNGPLSAFNANGLLEHLPDAVAVVDRAWRFLYVNAAYERMVRVDRREMIGRTMAEVFPQAVETSAYRQYQKAMDEQVPVNLEEFLAPLGIWADIRAFPTPETLTIIQRDISDRKQTEHALRDERKRAEEALQRSEQRLNGSQAIAHLGAWELDLLRNRLTWSDEVYRIFGLQPQEFAATYEAFLDAVHTEDRAAVDAAYTGSVREGRDAYEIEHRVVRRGTGEIRWVQEKCEHVRNEEGRIVLSVGMVLDITDRKRAEEALRQSEQHFCAIFERAGVGILEADQDDHFIAANDRVCQILGYSREQLLKMNVHELTYPEDRAHSDELNRAMIEGQCGRLDYEKRYLKGDGSPLWVHVTVSPVCDSGGRWLRAIATIEDISERKRAEDAIRDSEATHRTMFQLALVGMSQSEWGSARFLRVNDTLCQITGYSEEELLTMRFSDLDYPEDRARSLATYQKTTTGETNSYEIEKRYVRKDGRVIWVHVSVTVVRDAAGHPLYYLGAIQDITDRKQWDVQLRQAKEEAEGANRAKDQFIAALSHELRTPLTPVLTTVQMMRAAGDQAPEDRESLEMIGRNVELEVRLIDDLLDLTRISRGKLMLHMVHADLHDLQRRAIEICASDVQSKRLNLTVELQAPEHHVRGDAARLQQILWNLLKNAVKFTPPGGRITVCSTNPAPNRVAITVTDTGVGIQPSLLPRIFNAFEQGESARQFGGLGLGLAISRQIAELHDGRLTARSEGKDKGALFTLELGTCAEETKMVSSPTLLDSHAKRRTGGRILLVEDHPDTGRALSRVLTRSGYDVRIADTLAMARQLADAEKFDVLISDIGLPDGSGLDLMRQLRATRPIKGIALSGYGMEEDIRRSLEAGFAVHVTKPVRPDELEEHIARVVGDAALPAE